MKRKYFQLLFPYQIHIPHEQTRLDTIKMINACIVQRQAHSATSLGIGKLRHLTTTETHNLAVYLRKHLCFDVRICVDICIG
jgi:hypothetical protein